MLRLLGTALALLVLGLGCAAPVYYESRESYTPAISDVPPSFYDYDPTLRHWYTAPYWNPTIGP